MKDHLLRLVRHAQRANDVTLAALRRTRAPYAALQLFAHVLTTERRYLERIRGEAGEASTTRWPDLSLEQCSRLAEENASAYEAYFARCSEDDLQRPVPYVAGDGVAVEMTPADLLFHLALHGAHYRGQIARLVQEAGGADLPVDYAGYVRSLPRPPVRTSGSTLRPARGQRG